MTLMARTWLSLKRMLGHLCAALQKRGLSLHPSKCKAQTNIEHWSLRGEVPIEDGFLLDILPEGKGLQVLGIVLSLWDATQTEIPNRVASGWKLFWKMKPLLLNRNISVKQRLKLFDSTVGSCILWCSHSGTPRQEDLRLLSTSRRAKLRRLLGTARAPEEAWIDWMKLVTRKAVGLAQSQRVREWVHARGLSKWSWARHVARRPTTTWVWRTTVWRDAEWQSLALEAAISCPLQPSRRRWMKWEDCLRRHCATQGIGGWMAVAANRETWAGQADTSAKWFAAGV
jgi:hypothetical protein